MSSGERSAVAGLRERNRARTRAEIRAAALRLISEQGYAATTVDQIAKAADVSPSTFFRYFPTKEDAVMVDDLDAPMIEAFRRQPPEVSPLDAFRAVMQEVYGGMPEEVREQERMRIRIVLQTPELRDRMLGSLGETITMLAGIIAERVGRSPDDPKVVHFAGALTGVVLAAMFRANALDPDVDPLRLSEEAINDLADGLPL
ncbi:MAG TPA: TetR family transcriptional regulator [Asanoa sp.]|jgi:AcrR family transcriptional regulator